MGLTRAEFLRRSLANLFTSLKINVFVTSLLCLYRLDLYR